MRISPSSARKAAVSALWLAFLAAPAYAASIGDLEHLGNVSVQGIVGNVIRAFLGAAGSISLLMFVYGGFLWMTAAGNEEKIKKGKNTVVWASIGLITMFGAYTLLKYVFVALNTATAK